ncbi:hypothetical protein BO71DRAFT_399145 [Aspergillus ellipticus CBS 707.79]|uniref:Uncharacterized protein n=1 Tax=Aspergillus ellipticus CBS 707.79 TaxID=1448320 RepID=A0A319DA76_9EURO|nr:hypothetical protein BO71DRAFT_399145 [Aspergillus ellipticus CBS 707.79]
MEQASRLDGYRRMLGSKNDGELEQCWRRNSNRSNRPGGDHLTASRRRLFASFLLLASSLHRFIPQPRRRFASANARVGLPHFRRPLLPPILTRLTAPQQGTDVSSAEAIETPLLSLDQSYFCLQGSGDLVAVVDLIASTGCKGRRQRCALCM